MCNPIIKTKTHSVSECHYYNYLTFSVVTFPKHNIDISEPQRNIDELNISIEKEEKKLKETKENYNASVLKVEQLDEKLNKFKMTDSKAREEFFLIGNQFNSAFSAYDKEKENMRKSISNLVKLKLERIQAIIEKAFKVEEPSDLEKSQKDMSKYELDYKIYQEMLQSITSKHSELSKTCVDLKNPISNDPEIEKLYKLYESLIDESSSNSSKEKNNN